ncbi:flagellar rod protein FlaI [Vibrio galatheae]|uniref:Flagellar protein FliT n=1 Tax=Vibrio galatheae TaxID=579748 RepID=A0A0F4NLM6_9VIBR|nr:flagellar protein FliT [Vibrio galatheae]KJY83774.1 flagellar rod protein FlaI [Vibrio galatheae]
MHSVNEVESQLATLCELDHKMSETLTSKEINAEEIAQLVDIREQLLQSLLDAINEHPEFAQLQQWQDAVKRTQTVVELMQNKTSELALALQKYRHGKRSVQQYQKFL